MSEVGAVSEDEFEADEERQVNHLELFLDLVFVFAVTQIASLISHEPTGTGTAKGLLMAVLIWWQWSQFTWAGSAIDLEGERNARVLVLGCIPFALVMTISIPDVFHGGGIWFGSAYLGVQLLVLGMQASHALGDPRRRTAFVRYAGLASVSPVLVFIGGFLHGDAQIGFWVAAAVFNLLGALRGAGGEWALIPEHFVERHSLFIIISLGEVLVAAGASASAEGLDRLTAVAIVVSVAVACMWWWVYFAFIPRVTEQSLRRAHGPERGSLARDLFTFGHFPLMFGLILYAVVVKHLIPHPDGHLSVDDRWLLASSVVAFIGGLLAIQYRVRRRMAPERFVAIGVVAVLCLLGGVLPGLLVVGSVAVVLGVMQAITTHRFAVTSRAEAAALDEPS